MRDTTLDSELRETGVVTSRQERHRLSGYVGLDYRVEELTRVELQWRHYATRYEEDFARDADSDTGALIVRRELSSQRDVAQLEMTGTRTDSVMGVAEPNMSASGPFSSGTQGR